jgi:hypothetical protein
MTITEYWVTSSDNPYDPFTEWDDWLRTDRQLGYNLPGYVARDPDVSSLPSDAPPLVLQRTLEQAIDQICHFQLTLRDGVVFKKVSRVVEINDTP